MLPFVNKEQISLLACVCFEQLWKDIRNWWYWFLWRRGTGRQETRSREGSVHSALLCTLSYEPVNVLFIQEKKINVLGPRFLKLGWHCWPHLAESSTYGQANRVVEKWSNFPSSSGSWRWCCSQPKPLSHLTFFRSFFSFSFWGRSLWDLSSPTRDWTCTLGSESEES